MAVREWQVGGGGRRGQPHNGCYACRMSLECVVKHPAEPPAGTVIWLHGLGADGHDFEPLVPQLGLDVPLRFVFPHAPVRPVTINGGAEMRAWYDIDPRAPLAGMEDIEVAAAQVAELVEAERQRGIAPQRIVLAGFSQGGVVALHLALTRAERFAGVMALSTYVHDHENLAARVSFESVDVPIFMAHGRMDPMIPIARAVTAREALTALNHRVEWHEYDMGHHVCHEETLHIARWLQARFA